MHHIVYNTLQHKKESSRAVAVIWWLEWAQLPLDVPSSSFGCEWPDDGVSKICIDWRISKWRSWKIQMIGNIPKLQVATRSEVVVGEVGTAAFEFLATAPFAIDVAMQWISFESIAKCSIANEIIKSTNLKDHLLLSEGLSVEVIPLPHWFVSPSHFFIPLPQTLLKHFNLEPVFRAARDEDTPWTLRRWHSLLSSYLLGVDYTI
jgi:hypothetical protein